MAQVTDSARTKTNYRVIRRELCAFGSGRGDYHLKREFVIGSVRNDHSSRAAGAFIPMSQLHGKPMAADELVGWTALALLVKHCCATLRALQLSRPLERILASSVAVGKLVHVLLCSSCESYFTARLRMTPCVKSIQLNVYRSISGASCCRVLCVDWIV